MEKLKQVGYILGILLMAEVLEKAFNLPLPGAILGMILLALLLITGLIRLEDVEEGADSLIGLLAFLFVPILVGAKDSLGQLKGNLIQIIIVIVVATLVVLIVTAWLVQLLNRQMDKKRGHKDDYK